MNSQQEELVASDARGTAVYGIFGAYNYCTFLILSLYWTNMLFLKYLRVIFICLTC